MSVIRLSSEVLRVLESGVEVKGSSLRITQQLDRKLYTAVNKALEALGLKWSRKAKAHVAPAHIDVGEIVADAVTAGYVPKPNELDYFATPPDLAERMVDEARLLRPSPTGVLEPSAGEGALLAPLVKAFPDVQSFAIELHPRRFVTLADAFRPKTVVINTDFLTFDDLSFDVIVMNPPFSGNRAAKHVAHALSLLHPGGALVAVMPASVQFRTDGHWPLLRARAQYIEPLPEGMFKESGTMVNTCLYVAVGADQ